MSRGRTVGDYEVTIQHQEGRIRDLLATLEADREKLARLTKELEASLQREAKAGDDALEEAAQWHDAREASVRAEQQAETVRTGSRATGYWSAGVHRDAAKAFRALKSTPESNTQGGEG